MVVGRSLPLADVARRCIVSASCAGCRVHGAQSARARVTSNLASVAAEVRYGCSSSPMRMQEGLRLACSS